MAGWTFYASHGKSRERLLREEFQRDDKEHTFRVIDYAEDSRTAYVLIERKPEGAWKPDYAYINDADGSIRFVAVVLTKHEPFGDFGFKELVETMGPAERRCPKRLIDKASPLRPEYVAGGRAWAARWRADCLANVGKETR